MPSETPHTESTLPPSLYSLTPGTPLSITVTGIEDRLKSFYIGMERGRSFMIRLPMRSGIVNLFDYLYGGAQITVRYLHDGQVYGFVVPMLAYRVKPRPIIFLEFPTQVESHSLRKENRIDCLLPITAQVSGNDCPALLVDVSSAGCKLCMQDEAAGTPTIGDTISVDCSLFKAQGEKRINATVMSVGTDDPAHLSLGLVFKSPDPLVVTSIKEYVNRVAGLLPNGSFRAVAG